MQHCLDYLIMCIILMKVSQNCYSVYKTSGTNYQFLMLFKVNLCVDRTDLFSVVLNYMQNAVLST